MFLVFLINENKMMIKNNKRKRGQNQRLAEIREIRSKGQKL